MKLDSKIFVFLLQSLFVINLIYVAILIPYYKTFSIKIL